MIGACGCWRWCWHVDDYRQHFREIGSVYCRWRGQKDMLDLSGATDTPTSWRPAVCTACRGQIGLVWSKLDYPPQAWRFGLGCGLRGKDTNRPSASSRLPLRLFRRLRIIFSLGLQALIGVTHDYSLQDMLGSLIEAQGA